MCSCSRAPSAANIVLRREGDSDERIMEVCRYVNADRFINKLDHGLDEPVRERGNNFSAGQRQLISFARTILHEPSVMILDEATANIDTETELLIQDSLEKMRSVGTMLIVAPPAVHHPARRQHHRAVPRPDHRAGHPSAAAGKARPLLPALHPAVPSRTDEKIQLTA